MGRESREPREIEGSRKYTSIFIQTLVHDTEICYGSSSLSTNRENPENWVMDFRIQYKLEIVQIVFFVRLPVAFAYVFSLLFCLCFSDNIHR